LQLDKLDRYTCLKESGIVIPAEEEEDSSSDNDEDGSDSEDEDSGHEEKVADIDKEEFHDENLGDDEGVLDQGGVALMQDKRVCSSWFLIFDPLSIVCQDLLRSQANAFMGVAKDTIRSVDDIVSTPLPGETLAIFYARSRQYYYLPLLKSTFESRILGEFWAQKAHETSDNHGKLLRRDGFGLAEDRYCKIRIDFQFHSKVLSCAV